MYHAIEDGRYGQIVCTFVGSLFISIHWMGFFDAVPIFLEFTLNVGINGSNELDQLSSYAQENL